MAIKSLLLKINSEHAEKLREFYRDVVGLVANPDMGEGGFMAGATPRRGAV